MAKMPSTQAPCTVTTSSSSLSSSSAPVVVSVSSSRIPATLQAIFLASNRGQTVYKPPPTKVASKTYFRNWLFQTAGGHRSSNSKTSKTTTSTGQRSRFSFKNSNSNSSSSNSSTSTNTSSSTLSTSSTLPSGMRSPPRTTTSSNGSKYKIGGCGKGQHAAACCSSTKKQTDALVHAAIAAAVRLEQEQQQPQQQQSAATTASTEASDADESDSSSTSTEDVSVTATVTTTNNMTESASPLVSTVSVSPQSKHHEAAAVVGSLQDYLDHLLESRGYSTQRFPTLQTAYCNKPTPLQIASYHVHLINLARNQECHSFSALLCSGLSPNPANSHGESLLHTVCRRGLHGVLKVMLEKCHSTVAVADDYGRTPMHDAMWNDIPSLATITLLLKHGDAAALFFMEDARGALPLQYARKEHWPVWLEYLNHVKDDFWPVLNIQQQQQQQQSVPVPIVSPLLTSPPGSHPLVDPIHALPLEVAVLVASGKLSPAEAVFLADEDDESCCSDDEDDESGNDDGDTSQGSYDSDDDDDDDSSSSSSSWDDEEMDDMLQHLPITAATTAKMQ